MADDKRMGVLAADAFQDSEYFLPKVAIEKMGVHTEVVSPGTDPVSSLQRLRRRAGLVGGRPRIRAHSLWGTLWATPRASVSPF